MKVGDGDEGTFATLPAVAALSTVAAPPAIAAPDCSVGFDGWLSGILMAFGLYG